MRSRSINFADQFEATWGTASMRPIEQVIGKVESLETRQWLLTRLLEVELELRVTAGEKLAKQEYEQRFPEYASSVVEAFGSLQELESPSLDVGEQRTWEFHCDDTSRPSSPATRDDSTPASQPKQIGRFEILEMVGRGAFGRVYRARDPKLGRDVAIKVPDPERFRGDHDVTRFLREARAAAAIEHPNICQVYEIHDEDQPPYLVMAFIQGETLAARLDRGLQGTTRATIAWIAEVAEILEAAHRRGVVHRDLKPSNLMIDAKEQPIITDFGLARLAETSDDTLTAEGEVLGSPAYMSPEQARGSAAQIGPASDVYSLGVILFELLCGQRPRIGSTREILVALIDGGAAQSISDLRPEMDPHLVALVDKCLATEPTDRFHSMHELAAALREWLDRSESEVAADAARLPKKRDKAVKDRSRAGWVPSTSAALATLAIALCIALAAGVIHVMTDYGWLTIEPSDQSIKIEILQQGKTVRVADAKSGSRIRLKSGAYEIMLRGEEDGVTVSPKQIVMTRGGRPTVRILVASESKVEPAAPMRSEVDLAWERLRNRAAEVRDLDPNEPSAAEVRWQLVQFAALQANESARRRSEKNPVSVAMAG